jgi:hypothetical protein
MQNREAISRRNSTIRGGEIPHTSASLVYFNYAVAEIIAQWNDGSVALSGVGLRSQIEAKSQERLSESDWKILTLSFCSAVIGAKSNAARFLLLGTSDDEFVINYPALTAYLSSSEGKEWQNAYKFIAGIELGPLRTPATAEEAEWVRWLATSFTLGTPTYAQSDANLSKSSEEMARKLEAARTRADYIERHLADLHERREEEQRESVERATVERRDRYGTIMLLTGIVVVFALLYMLIKHW